MTTRMKRNVIIIMSQSILNHMVLSKNKSNSAYTQYTRSFNALMYKNYIQNCLFTYKRWARHVDSKKFRFGYTKKVFDVKIWFRWNTYIESCSFDLDFNSFILSKMPRIIESSAIFEVFFSIKSFPKLQNFSWMILSIRVDFDFYTFGENYGNKEIIHTKTKTWTIEFWTPFWLINNNNRHAVLLCTLIHHHFVLFFFFKWFEL